LPRPRPSSSSYGSRVFNRPILIALALSTFFALHRPISVHQILPRIITNDAFAEIFSQPSRSHKVTDVLSTLSQTVHDLEQPLAKLNIANGDKQQQDVQEAQNNFANLGL
jgi:hypothetical protein